MVEWLLLLSKVRGSIPIGFSVRTLIYRLYFSSDVSKAGRGQELAILKTLTGFIGVLSFKQQRCKFGMGKPSLMVIIAK